MSAFTLAQDVLDVAVAALVDPPDRQYVHWSDIAADCDQLVVGIRGISVAERSANAGPARVRCAQVPVVEFWVELHRCGPVPDDNGNAPSPADLQAFAEVMSDDAEALVCEFLQAIARGELPGPCQAWSMNPSEPLGPQGGFSGVRLRLIAQLNCTGGGS